MSAPPTFTILYSKQTNKKSIGKTFLSYEQQLEGGKSLSANIELLAAAPASSVCHFWWCSFPCAAISVQQNALLLHLHAEAR